jgi:hypothetical protein
MRPPPQATHPLLSIATNILYPPYEPETQPLDTPRRGKPAPAERTRSLAEAGDVRADAKTAPPHDGEGAWSVRCSSSVCGVIRASLHITTDAALRLAAVLVAPSPTALGKRRELTGLGTKPLPLRSAAWSG